MAKREAPSGRAGSRKADKPSSKVKAKKAAPKAAVPSKTGSNAKSKKDAPKASRPAVKAASKARRAVGLKSGPKSKAKAAAPRLGSRRERASGKQPAGRARTARPAAAPRPPLTRPPVAAAGLSDEEQILAAKYLPRDLPPRLFEEERFLFPESYHVNRVRLLVKDPDWIFAYWDVDPKALEGIAKTVGERSMALARLSLRVSDPQHGGSTDILLPAGARWWYVRADSSARSYKAELGVILPSGEFRQLAESNRVTTPRVGPSSSSARRRVPYRQAGVPGVAVPAEAEDALESGDSTRSRQEDPLGPWTTPSVDGTAGPLATEPEKPAPGGASDAFRPGGASDVYRR
jgi:hypothetical protein